ncbi:DUF3037 domain-containing protein [Rhizobium sp.]|jgi:hypothetical protein|uniref:DUF3037 domain-containing protein n=1 Tax=Rhizobium sp. TaxID=391 RepID=UPI000E9FDF6E|nr:DUF3037 domain-containing protein [Rhizobium sp.]
MKKHAISYAIIRFQPHIETEEFANIGIVLVAPRIGYLDFKLETRRLGRVTSFFDSVEPATVRLILKNYYTELKRIKEAAGHNGDGQTRMEFGFMDNAEHLFYALTKEREGIIRFSDVRFAMTDSPEDKLAELFEYYVNRDFSSPIYREGILEKHVRDLLNLKMIGRSFKKKSFNDGIYQAKFPFVELVGDKPVKILKPLFLGQDDPTRILDHSNKWLFTVNRLKTLLPKNIIFAVEGPHEPSARQEAFNEAIDRFRNNHIQVVDVMDEQKLLSAAAA